VDVPAKAPDPTRPEVLVRDVTMRDGLQDEAPISTDAKLAIFEALVLAGVREVELTSFVRADRIPALADAEEVVAATAAVESVTKWGLVLNRRGAERAVAAGLDHLQFVFSVSEAHNLENAGRTVAQSLDELTSIRAAAGPDVVVETTLATAFGCPFTGAVDPDAVARCVDAVLATGVDGIGLADTIGTGAPSEVRRVVARTVAVAGDLPVGAHLHDTRGMALANAFAAVESGAVRVDASLGGLGGCPFAPGASGNLPIEDLVHAFEVEGIRTGIHLDRLIEASRLACRETGRAVASHVGVAGPRFAAP
jgi:hydroxymethylglutaryl-CoA lyase